MCVYPVLLCSSTPEELEPISTTDYALRRSVNARTPMTTATTNTSRDIFKKYYEYSSSYANRQPETIRNGL